MQRRVVLVRAFSASSRLQAVQQVAPEQAFKDLSSGIGAIVDLRADNDGVKVHESAVVYPFEAILGSASGLASVPGTFTRNDLLALITPEQLDVASYHEAALVPLARIRYEVGDKNLTHAKAQAYIKKRLDDLEANPKKFYENYAAEQLAKHSAKIKALKSMVAANKATPSVTAFLKQQREMYDRYLKLPATTPSRFAKLSNDAAVNDNHDFQDSILAAVRQVIGSQADHAAAQTYLKKKLTPAALKSDKEFVEQFYAEFSAQREAARLKHIVTLKGKSGKLDDKGREFLNKERARVAGYLAYKTNPTTAELAVGLSDAALKRLAGVHNGNLGEHVKRLAEENAKAAIKALPQTRPLYLIDNASVQSTKVAELLVAQGAGDVRVVAGGVDRWLTHGLPTHAVGATKVALEAHIAQSAREQPNIADIND